MQVEIGKQTTDETVVKHERRSEVKGGGLHHPAHVTPCGAATELQKPSTGEDGALAWPPCTHL
jgi:hypothetical protein